MNKTCRKCGKNKPLSDFHKQKAGYLRCRPDCKECRKHITSSWYKNNSDRIKTINREYASKNREKIRARGKEYYQKNIKKESRALSSRNSSGYNGVRFAKNCNRWQAFIRVDYELYNLGFYKDIKYAILARKIADIVFKFQ